MKNLRTTNRKRNRGYKLTETINHKEFRTKCYWVGARTQRIMDMEDAHIVNTILMLDRREEACDRLGVPNLGFGEFTSDEWIVIFKCELKFRRVIK